MGAIAETTFGGRIRAARKALGLSQQDLADAVGCGKSYLCVLETQPDQHPSAGRVMCLAKVLGVTVYELMGEPNPWALASAAVEDRKFIESYLKLPPVDRRRMRRLLVVLEE
ncbi:MAG: helix-turn-helix transcriptional regulator [Burkholderiales bacterium]|nr:helix-turn-helix transcriptional regulator [Burkholderiales bacterium]